MVNLTVNLTPPLTGVQGEMWVMFLVGGVGYWYKLIDIPTSVNGVIGPFGYSDGFPNNSHQIRFPEQTIAGITYEEAGTNAFGLNQNWTFNVVLNPLPTVDRPSSLTISADSSVLISEPFNISGLLYETDTGVPIPNQSISLSYNGANLGSATTGVDGDYLKNVSIPSAGVYTLKAYYAGNSNFGASASSIRIRTGESSTEILPWLAILGAVIASVFVIKHYK